MGALLGPDFPGEIALAVSGGGDSMAMLALAHTWARTWGVGLRVVTIDHGLRAESASEAEMVARECAALGHSHTALRWHWDGKGNVMDAARRARLELIGHWRGDLRHVLMAHTADDVAETFLLRLARGSGVDGLAAMQARRTVPQGFEVIRPCLDMRRAELRHYARVLHVPWVEDPTNDNPKYERARARQMLPPLTDLGLSPSDLTDTAKRLLRAREALQARAISVADDLVVEHASGTLLIDRDGFAGIERETQLRLLAAAMMWISGAAYRPRVASLEDALDRALSGGVSTLSGAKLDPVDGTIFVYRELGATQGPLLLGDEPAIWDARWRVSGANCEISALGEGIRSLPNWREAGVPRAALMAMPAIFEAERCVAAPILYVNPTCHLFIDSSFRDFLLSH